jgi:hypothetical protein
VAFRSNLHMVGQGRCSIRMKCLLLLLTVAVFAPAAFAQESSDLRSIAPASAEGYPTERARSTRSMGALDDSFKLKGGDILRYLVI